MARIRFSSFSFRSPDVRLLASQPAFYVIGSEAELLDTYGFTRYEPPLDFDRYFLVTVHRGRCPTGGYALAVEEVSQDGHEVMVRVRLRDPGPGQMVTLVMTYPQAMVLLRRSDLVQRGRLRFRFVDQDGQELAVREATIA